MKKYLLLFLLSVVLIGCTQRSTSGLLILQAYGNGGSTTPAISNSFVELYNDSENTISLDGMSIQYSEPTINKSSIFFK